MKPTRELKTISVRLPAWLIKLLDDHVEARSPEIKNRTQLLEIVLTKFVKSLNN